MEQVYGAGGLKEVSYMHLLYTFLLTEAALGEDFKETWVKVNSNAPITFIPDITNEENE